MTIDTDRVRQLVVAANPIPDPESLGSTPGAKPVDGVTDEPRTTFAPTVRTRPPLSRLRLQPTAVVASAAVLTMVGLLVALGSMKPSLELAGPASPQPVVLTNESCASEQIGVVLPGLFTFTVLNGSSFPAQFELNRLEVTYDEFAGYYAEENEILREGQSPRVERDGPPLPEATTVDSTATLDAGRSGLLEGDLTAGTYAITCEQLDTDDYAGVFSVGPFEVID
jgi:hypothetical protein